MLGSANFRAGPVMAFMSGNLCYQIEHHLYPDLPSNRLAEIAQRVEALCAKYDLPYTTGSLARQYLLTLRTICKLALPDRFLSATSDDALETASEGKFRTLAERSDLSGVRPSASLSIARIGRDAVARKSSPQCRPHVWPVSTNSRQRYSRQDGSRSPATA